MLIVIVLMATSEDFTAQDIQLANPSFEGIPQVSTLPDGWIDCGTRGYSSPDTQPNDVFQVTQVAQDGATYLGMVTRADDSFECVTQRLSSPMLGGECYEFSIYLAKSNSYLSGTLQNKHVKKQHTAAIKLRVFGANSIRGDSTFLDETRVIDHTNWQQYHFKLKPETDFTYIKLQAFYKTPVLFSYIGNVLIDNCSTIKWVSCDEEAQPLAVLKKKELKKPEPIQKPRPKPIDNDAITKKIKLKSTPPKIQPGAPVVITQTPGEPMEDAKIISKKPKPKPKVPKKPFSIAELDKNSIIEGQTIRIDRINFPKKSAEFADSSIIALNELYDFLQQNPEIVVEIGGHTNQLASYTYSIELSQKRATSVVRYLIEKGIEKKRISAKGYGREAPLDKSSSKAAHVINQRVEIKIISIGE